MRKKGIYFFLRMKIGFGEMAGRCLVRQSETRILWIHSRFWLYPIPILVRLQMFGTLNGTQMSSLDHDDDGDDYDHHHYSYYFQSICTLHFFTTVSSSIQFAILSPFFGVFFLFQKEPESETSERQMHYK